MLDNNASSVPQMGGAYDQRLSEFVVNCTQVSISSTTKLRQHLIRHDVQVATNPSGRLSKDKKDVAIQWYNSLVEAEENNNKDNVKGKGNNDNEDGDEGTAPN
ncbi:hypothetical protein N7463_004099 [Penicillium fimorum]|uniref:Uncharacterized protein n=1 Tax=Penicillium fimorum TaxID=1882269 RepID=A0A9X0CA34_9EURO|nr:hypothetical protein N7463_004099 [Penicillium fimorum]